MRLLKAFFLVAVVIVAVVAASYGVARLTLPETSCSVTEAQIDALVLSKMSYDDVSRALGCAGARKSREEYGTIVVETYAWRGAVWPFGKFEGEFINGRLEGTSKTWLNLELSGRKPEA
ncbi:MAG: hypothetical protein ABUL43_02630 [Hyphomicrobium sp.]